MQRRTLVAVAATLPLGLAGAAWAQAYPSKPVRLIVPFAPGGTTDIVARTLSDKIAASLGQAMIVENKAGGGGHLQMELFKSLSGTFITHIPYRGAGPALNDTIAGQVPMIFDNLPSALPFIKDGRLIPIVVAAPARLAQLPNVPTFKEVGLEPV